MTFGEERAREEERERAWRGEQVTQGYDDIIDLPRPKMQHARMSHEARAAQFAPFAALAGYYDLVEKQRRERLEEVAQEERFEVDIDAQIELEEDEEAQPESET